MGTIFVVVLFDGEYENVYCTIHFCDSYYRFRDIDVSNM